MRAPEIDTKLVLLGALAVALVVAISIGAAFGLLRIWGEPSGGFPSGAPAIVAALKAAGPVLQTAPQADVAVQVDRASQPARSAARASEPSR